jgi:transcriptional regulator with XRE-family HTH domain
VRLPTLLKQARLANGFESLQEVKDATGIDRGLLSQFESGRRLPPDRDIPQLELAYGPPALWYEPSVLLAIQRDNGDDGGE